MAGNKKAGDEGELEVVGLVPCPNCGKKIKEPPVLTSIGKQISIYLISFLLPPFGLAPGIRYLMQPDQKAKIIGIVAILLTIVSIGLTIWFTMNFLNEY